MKSRYLDLACSDVKVHEVHETMQLTDAQGVVDLIRAFLVKERSDRAMVHRCELIMTMSTKPSKSS